MDPAVRNYLYRNPHLYELVFPDPDQATARMCLRMFERFLPRPPRSILDIGCGTARDLDILSQICSDCWGVDYVDEQITYAQQIRPHLNLLVGDMRTVRLNRTFDVVMCMGSTLCYALSNEDVQQTLATFAAHAHEGTLLIIDINNASHYLEDSGFKKQVLGEIDTVEFSAKAVSLHSLDYRRQLLVRHRTWTIPGKDPVEDYCQYRLFFPAELEHYLADAGFEVLGIFDNKELQDSDLSDSRLYIAARWDAQESLEGEYAV